MMKGNTGTSDSGSARRKGAKPNGKSFKLDVTAWFTRWEIELLGTAGQGAYVRLLAHAFLDPSHSLPDDDEALAALSSLGALWREPVGRRVRAMFRAENGRLYAGAAVGVYQGRRSMRGTGRRDGQQ
jgi:hypothetical protein